jgi:hypothetical protein
MKYINLTICLLIAGVTFSQKNAFGNKSTKISLDIHAGVNSGNGIQTGFATNIGLSYAASKLIQLRGDFGNDWVGDNHISRVTGHVVMNLTEKIKLDNTKYGFAVHAGTGFSLRKNPLKFPSDNIFSGDKMVNLVFGATPSYKLNDKFTLQVDISYVQLYLNSPDLSGYLNTMLGLSYKF